METKLSDYKETEAASRKKVRLTFLPLNVTVEGEEGKSILELALEHDIPLDHNCGGNCACTTCHVIVKQGMENLTEAEDNEDDMLDKAEGVTLSSRLGCQSHVYGDVVVEIPGR
ncbi:MAG: 2Fe-2S iron-sulfur cluster binding domain-containing protein [Nitrospirae bacterium]|nr:2Fe-2S iron-sulfur cluster binding domain-containing protein [Nitrospirota bacterium]